MAVVAILQQLALYQIYDAMMMMFVVTPSLESIEHKLNSKSNKFPKLYKVPTLEAININKP
jgi:beta-lactamase regulating signal transducer with metallopeptidase domain